MKKRKKFQFFVFFNVCIAHTISTYCLPDDLFCREQDCILSTDFLFLFQFAFFYILPSFFFFWFFPLVFLFHYNVKCQYCQGLVDFIWFLYIVSIGKLCFFLFYFLSMVLLLPSLCYSIDFICFIQVFSSIL